MISDQDFLAAIRQKWKNDVEGLRDKAKRSTYGSLTTGPFAMSTADQVHNPPFINACAVLNDILKQIAKERRIKSGRTLGVLVNDLKDKLSWKDFVLIKEIVCLRNEVAHRGLILPRTRCWDYIDAIKVQLIEWQILESDNKG